MKKKMCVLAIAGIMATSTVLAGCGPGSTSGAGNTDKQAGANTGYVTTYGEKQFDDAKISVEIFDRSNAPEGSTCVDNKWVDYINQEMNKVGIQVEMVAVPRAEESTKMQVMMASNTAPDIIFTYDRSLAEDYYAKGGTLCLNDYIDGEEQAKNLKEYVTPEVIDLCRNDAGDLWGLTAKRTSTAKNNLFIRKDWVDKLGMDMPTTPEELYAMLAAFKEQNPDHREDVIPCSLNTIGRATVSILAETFMESVADETQFNISSFCPIYTDDGYVEYLRFLNKLYNEGLMDPEYYANTNIEEDMVNGRTGFLEWGVIDNFNFDRLNTLHTLWKDADITAVPALKNVNDGKQYGIADPVNGMYIIIPKTCKNVEAAVTYLDWLSSKDGGYVLYNGFEDEHYTLEDGVAVVKDPAYNEKDKDWIRMDLFLMGNPGYFQSEEEMIDTMALEKPDFAQYVRDDYAVAETGIIRTVSSYVSPSQSANYSDIDVVMEENQVKCITCAPGEFDAQIDIYRKALKEAGMDEVVAERTEYFSEK
ncbi:MAG: extracellular solute-binding protein [Lachnospiraceae bacterium]|nr:extracellular solute-binding protein [Lachnospiraceae bacterium]